MCAALHYTCAKMSRQCGGALNRVRALLARSRLVVCQDEHPGGIPVNHPQKRELPRELRVQVLQEGARGVVGHALRGDEDEGRGAPERRVAERAEGGVLLDDEDVPRARAHAQRPARTRLSCGGRAPV